MTDNRRFDAVPFAARREWTSDQDYEVWWDDPRDLFEVSVEFAPGAAPEPSRVRLSYWQSVWPKVRVPKGADVGSGREGWLAIDDWTNGRWQVAHCTATVDGDALRFTFLPLDEREFPEEGFAAAFRRTIKLRVHVEGLGADPVGVQALTDSAWEETEVSIEWRAIGDRLACWDGRLEVYNGAAIAVEPLDGGTVVSDEGEWRSTVSGSETGGIRATVRYAANEDTNSYDRTIVTVRSEGHTFSFLVDDVIAGPVYVRDFGVLATRSGDNIRLQEFEAARAVGGTKTLYQRILSAPEQTWGRAWGDMPPKGRFYFVIGTEGGRQKFGVEPSGDLFLRENFIRRVPGEDTPRLQWGADGKAEEIVLGFGLPQEEPGDRSILEGYLPVIRASWADGGLAYEEEAFATWLFGDQHFEEPEGDAPVVAMVRLTMANLGPEPQTASLTLTSTAGRERQKALEPEALALRGDLVIARAARGDWVRELVDTGGAGDLTTSDSSVLYQIDLAPGAEHSVVVKVPFVGLAEGEELARLRALSYDEERERVVTFWRERTMEGAQIETPNQTLNDFYRSHLMHMLVINDQEPGSDRRVARCGGFHYGSFPDEGCMAISDLDRRGYTQEAERCLELYVHYQGTVPLPGNFQSADGVFYGSGGYEVSGYNRNQGWVLWCLAEHYRYSRDRGWLERVAPALVKGCDWIARERQATMMPLDERDQDDGSRPIDYGFLPTGSLEDVTDYWTWLSTNAYAYQGFRSAAEVLAEIDHPEAGRLAEEARAYGDDLRCGFFEACARSPVVRLRDGTWVPHFPPRQQRRGRDFGWLREVLEGAAHLVYCGIIAPDEPAAQWIVDDYEDNLFLSDQYGYPAPEFERQWFSWGGFSMQPNLLIWPLLYLARDEPKHYLRSYFNPFASAFYPDTRMLTEHALPTLGDWRGDHFKSSDEALSTWWLRLMFLAEHGDELMVGQAIPREWFEDGKTMRVLGAQTHFGKVSLEIRSFVATGTIAIRLEPPTRNPPERIRLRVRHPDGARIRSAWVDGRPHHAIDLEREIISLEGCTEPVEVRVVY